MRNKILIAVLVLGMSVAAPLVLATTSSRNTWTAIWSMVDNINFRLSGVEQKIANSTSLNNNALAPTAAPVVQPVYTPPPILDNTPTPLPKRRFKILQMVDACMLTKLGQDGWDVVTEGDVIDLVTGFDDDCKKLSTTQWVKGYDTVLVEQVQQQ